MDSTEDFAMLTEQSRVIVEDAVCAGCAVHTKQVHHRDFPEIRAECGSIAEAVAHLAGQLSSARDGTQSHWHHELIDRAIADVAEFLNALAQVRQADEAACQCGARVAGETEAMLPGPYSS
jgi:hypothetical protein